jgi:hypothetical protein
MGIKEVQYLALLPQDVITIIHGRVGDGGVAGREQERCRCLCGVERGEMTEVSDAGSYPHRPEEANLAVCRHAER